jgi:membrane-bound ClpP family serine protease
MSAFLSNMTLQIVLFLTHRLGGYFLEMYIPGVEIVRVIGSICLILAVELAV